MSSNTSQFTGREADPTGLYYYRARYYDPVHQRFLSEDPIGFEGGLNSYAYVDNNPTGFVDPNGLQKEFPFLIWVGPPIYPVFDAPGFWWEFGHGAGDMWRATGTCAIGTGLGQPHGFIVWQIAKRLRGVVADDLPRR